jgi:hypothetical protein
LFTLSYGAIFRPYVADEDDEDYIPEEDKISLVLPLDGAASAFILVPDDEFSWVQMIHGSLNELITYWSPAEQIDAFYQCWAWLKNLITVKFYSGKDILRWAHEIAKTFFPNGSSFMDAVVEKLLETQSRKLNEGWLGFYTRALFLGQSASENYMEPSGIMPAVYIIRDGTPITPQSTTVGKIYSIDAARTVESYEITEYGYKELTDIAYKLDFNITDVETPIIKLNIPTRYTYKEFETNDGSAPSVGNNPPFKIDPVTSKITFGNLEIWYALKDRLINSVLKPNWGWNHYFGSVPRFYYEGTAAAEQFIYETSVRDSHFTVIDGVMNNDLIGYVLLEI